ncbi:MAG: hypothetical protein RL265_1879 [Bacteroidota bacterium]
MAADGELYSGYREKGYFPEAFINMLAFLGWNPGTTKEIFSLEELTEAFTLDRVSKSGAKFDPEKTKWFQQNYLRDTSDTKLAESLAKEINNTLPIDKLINICHLMKERATFVRDIAVEGIYLFEAPQTYDEQTVSKKWKDGTKELMELWLQELETLDAFTAQNIEERFKLFLEKTGLGIGAVLPLFRLLITGTGAGPSMFEIGEFLGKEECLSRMNQGIDAVETLKK